MWVKEQSFSDPDNLREIKKMYVGDSGNLYVETDDGKIRKIEISTFSPDGYVHSKLELISLCETGAE